MNRFSTHSPLFRSGGALTLLVGAVLLIPSQGRTVPSPHTTAPVDSTTRIDADMLLRDLSILAHDSMEGRRTGTPGNASARRYLLQEFMDRGSLPVDGRRTQDFEFEPGIGSGEMTGINVFGLVPGREYPDRYLVISAHYDHLGVQGGEIYNGADDNASGTAVLLSLVDYFARNPPSHSLLFVAFDAEEMGLRGAGAFVADPPIPLDAIALNVNLDMVSRSATKELYAAGTFHYPFLNPLVDEVARQADLELLKGHDSPDLATGDDWTLASDHAAFHEVGIPFLYFGVEDHEGYHHPSDTYQNITPEFFVSAAETILHFLLVVDREAPFFPGAGVVGGTFDLASGRPY